MGHPFFFAVNHFFFLLYSDVKSYLIVVVAEVLPRRTSLAPR